MVATVAAVLVLFPYFLKDFKSPYESSLSSPYALPSPVRVRNMLVENCSENSSSRRTSNTTEQNMTTFVSDIVMLWRPNKPIKLDYNSLIFMIFLYSSSSIANLQLLNM